MHSFQGRFHLQRKSNPMFIYVWGSIPNDDNIQLTVTKYTSICTHVDSVHPVKKKWYIEDHPILHH